MGKVIKITESELRRMIGDAISEAINEKEVTRFTPYTEEQAKRNHSWEALSYGTRETRNPAYAQAKKEAEQRKRQQYRNTHTK